MIYQHLLGVMLVTYSLLNSTRTFSFGANYVHCVALGTMEGTQPQLQPAEHPRVTTPAQSARREENPKCRRSSQEPENPGGQEGLQQRGTTRSGLLSTVGF